MSKIIEIAKSLKETLILEPAVVMYLIACCPIGPIDSRLKDYKTDTCRGPETCFYYEGFIYLELLMSRIGLPISTIFLLFLSDKLALRRPFILLPFFGNLLLCCNLLIFERFIEQVPFELFFTLNIIAAFSGLDLLLFALLLIDAADNTSPRYKTPRIMLAFLIKSVTVNNIGGLIDSSHGSTWLYISALLTILSIVYVLFRVKEQTPRPAWKALFKCDLSGLKSAVKDRKIVLFVVLSIYLVWVETLAPVGERLTRWAWFFDATEEGDGVDIYTFPGSIEMAPLVVATALSSLWRVNEIMVLSAAIVLKIVASVLFSMSIDDGFTYGVMVVDCGHVLIVPLLTSLGTKMVSSHIAASIQILFTFSGIFNVVIDWYALPIYYQSYIATKGFFSGLFHYISVVLYFIPLPLLRWLHLQKKKTTVRRIGVKRRQDVVFHV